MPLRCAGARTPLRPISALADGGLCSLCAYVCGPVHSPPCRQERRRRKEKEERRKKRKTLLTMGTTFCMQSPRAAHALRLNARRSCSIPQFASCFPLPGFFSLPFRFPSSLVFPLSYFFLYIFSSLDLPYLALCFHHHLKRKILSFYLCIIPLVFWLGSFL